MENTITNLPDLIQYSNNIVYSDGAETALFDIVSNSSFNEFTAWRNKSDWAQYYHLSPLRKNILSWINFGNKPIRILELGAGCGAITSFLITIPNAEIIAVEGSLKRAQVIQARCKNNKNLTIHACSFDTFKPDDTFDIITLVGVLEYSGRYEQGDDPFTSILKRAAGWLSERGSLIVAIENQLGVKYLSGCEEDHYGVAFEGVNNYPHYNGVKTFTKTELGNKLINAGLPVQSWFYPYPDYKLPSVIISDQALKNKRFDYMALTDVPPEPNENQNPFFDNRSFLRLVGKNCFVGNFMNSFLVVATKNIGSDFLIDNKDLMAVKFNVKFRAKHFQTSTNFRINDDSITVTKKQLYPIIPLPECEIKIDLSQEPEPYFQNTINIFDAITHSVLDNRYNDALHYINIYTSILNKASICGNKETINTFTNYSRKCLKSVIYANSFNELWIPGSFVDLIPLNVLIPVSNKLINPEQCKTIDLEWQLPLDIPLQLVFDRGMALVTNKLLRIIKLHGICIHQQSRLPLQLYNLLKDHLLYKSIDINSLNLFETWFQNTIMGKNDIPLIDNFIEKTVVLFENGKIIEALEYYDKFRSFYSQQPELPQIDKLINSVRAKINS